MANTTLQSRLVQKNDTSANWASENPVLLNGELGIESDTKKAKLGDGVNAWNDLEYWSFPASILANARVIKMTGAATGQAPFDGSKDIEILLTLSNQPGLSAGTYTKLTINAQGVVTAAAQIAVDDIAGLGTAAKANTGTAIGNVPVIGSDGKLNPSIMPPITLTEPFVVDSEAEMLELDAQTGDIAIRTDESKSYILRANDPSVLANWQELLSGAGVLSINGKSGVVVLTTDDIDEGSTHLYFTDARVKAFLENTNNVFILNGGNANGF